MPEVRKNTPAKAAPAKAAPVKAAAPAFDFSALAVKEAPAPTRNGATSVTPETNPAVKWLEQSWSDRSTLTDARVVDGKTVPATFRGGGKAVTVPAAQEKEVYRLLRLAADHLKLGASIDTTTVPDEQGRYTVLGNETTKDEDGNVTFVTARPNVVSVRFAAKTRKAAYKRTTNGN
jgi:hypothetical protein